MEILNLSTGETFYYPDGPTDILEEMELRIKNLISVYLLENKKTSLLHNQNEREKLKLQVVSGKETFGLGDFAVKKFK